MKANITQGKAKIKNVTLNVRVGKDIKDLFETYCRKEGRKKKWVATKALENFLEERGYKINH